MSNEIVALLPLPVEAEMEIIASGPIQLRDLLASSPFLSENAAMLLLSASRPLTQWRAIRRITDTERLEHYIRKGTIARAAAAARNPASDVDSLEFALTSTADPVVLAALVNPTTKEQDRKATATPAVVDRLVNVGGSLGHSVIRAAEVVLHNPWMTESPEQWDGAIQRAIASSPDTSVVALARLRSASRSGGKFLRSHPLLRNEGASWSDFTTDALLEYKNPAADLQAMRRADFALKHARNIMNRADVPAEPQVIARILDRYGFAARVGLLRERFSGTRVSATQWSTPCTEFIEYTPVSATEFESISSAVQRLGTDRESWATLLGLYPTWKLSFEQLASTAQRLHR